MAKKTITVTVAVSALNEQYNIKAHLESILMQKEISFRLKEVIVISDGSSDQTAAMIREVKSNKIRAFIYQERIGKSSRLNQIFAKFDSDILVISDADVVFGTETTITELIKPLVHNSRVGLVGGHPEPLPAATFTEKAVNLTLEAYIPLRKILKNGHNVLSATGRIMALRRELAKSIKVAKQTISNDGFIYFSCLVKGWQYRYAFKAKAFFRSPQNLYDHINQNTRFDATPAFMMRYFPRELVEKEYFIPPELLLLQKLKQFLKHPILASYIFAVNQYCQFKAKIDLYKISSLWEVVYSTKKLAQVNSQK